MKQMGIFSAIVVSLFLLAPYGLADACGTDGAGASAKASGVVKEDSELYVKGDQPVGTANRPKAGKTSSQSTQKKSGNKLSIHGGVTTIDPGLIF